MRKAIKITSAALLGLALLLTTLNLSGSQQGGAAYADRQLKIYDRSTHGKALHKAARQWNGSGLNLKIVFVQKASQADVIAKSVKRFTRRGCTSVGVMGCASVGRKPWPYKGRLELRDAYKQDRTNPKFVDIASHEIGHLLGLRHTDRHCALMNNNSRCRKATQEFKMDPTCPAGDGLLSSVKWCPSSKRQEMMCGPNIEELKKLIRIYGGEIREGYSPWCASTQKQSWRGWCIYPHWTPRGEQRPGFIRGSGKGARCIPGKTPADYKLALREAILELQEVQREAKRPANITPLLNSAYQAYREERMKTEKRQASQEIERLKSSLDQLTRQPASD